MFAAAPALFVLPFVLLLLHAAAELVDEPRQQKVPSAPRDVEVIQVNASTVKVSWQRPAHSNGVLIGYYVYKEQLINGEPVSDQLQRAMVIHDPDKLHAIIGGLEPNTEYGFRVNAYNRKGDGEFSSSRKIMTGGLPPSEPLVQSVSLLTHEPPLKALVVWKTPQKTYDMPILKYVVWYKPLDHIEYSRKDIEGTVHQAELDGLLMGRLYEIKVAAENADGLSANATESLNTPIGVPETPPLNVRYEFDDGKLEISWDPPSIDQRNGNISYYYAILTPPEGSGGSIAQNVTSGRSTTFMASATKAYSFKVAAATVKGQGPFSTSLEINPDPSALVPPPERVRVQATSNSSVVVTWSPSDGEIDGYVVKYIHEPTAHSSPDQKGQRQSDSWQERMVSDKSATHVEITGLLTDKPYAFCVIAVRDSRQGACSDPPTTIDQLKPTYMVSNLRVVWKTDHSVMLNWDYNGPMPIKFLVSQTGRKNYLDQFLVAKSMVSPSMRFEVDGTDRLYKWTSLRPYMEYTFQVGVVSMQSGEEYWPKEVTAKTSAAGPPFVDSPEFVDSQSSDRATIKLKMASEEYGPISHYWLIVVPANFSQEDLPRLDNNILRAKSAVSKRRLKRATDEGAYITMQLEAAELRKKNQTDHEFVVGDNKEYGDFRNHPLDSKEQYKLMLRAFAVDDDTSKSFDMLVPPTETKGKLWSDSMLSKTFETKPVASAGRTTKPGNVWLIGPIIAILIITVIVGMLIIWWMKRNKKKQPHNRHGSITKVALGPNSSETSKLLVGPDGYGRQHQPMHPYDHMNGNGGLHIHGDSHMEMYPMPQGMGNHYAPVPVPIPVSVPSLPSIGHSLSHPPIPITELAAHIDRLKANDCMLFSQEYESIETGQQFTWEHSNMEANKPKNRYANVVAYDHSRVMLTPLDHGQIGSDYINANYIDGYRKSKGYIATQGPLPETFADFWRMVWDEQTVTIVMLTKLEERSRIKCDQYWPMRGAHGYGQVQVTLVDTLDLAHYTIRTMRIQRRGETEVRDIRHLQFTAWPDHGVPDHPTPFLMFLKRVKSLNPPEAGPVIAHCSAGIGRTGAFIAIDCMLERLRYENTVDVFGCVTALRSQRSYMVQTEDQYVFIHDAVLDAVQSGSTEVPAGKLFTHIQALMQVQPLDQASGMELEFRHLAALKMLNCRCTAANLPANKGKNRLVNMVPFDSSRVRLSPLVGNGEDGSDYINASWIDGYRKRRSYIATQGPLPNTIDDFWRMLWEHESCIVVMLTKLRELGREKCTQYYPSERSARYGQLVIEPIAEYNMPQYVLREFKMTDTTTGQSRTIRHFQYMDWPEQGSPKSGELFVEFIGQVHKTKEQFGVDGPITVHCSTGAGRSGVFVTLSIVLERMRYENVVDIFTTVKLLRTQRQNMVQSEDQYHFCYQAALEYLGSFDMYGVQ